MDTVLQLTRLNGPVFALNPDLIERAEATPDTVVTLVNGARYVICESLDELTSLITDYRATIIATAQLMADSRRRESVRPAPRDVPRGDTRNSVIALRPGER
jgi:flagellar protein FlbD